ncbi:MAG: ATP-dependent DNA ligase [Sphingomonas sp.]|nr:MAG: ATP-dependent DNA ligase [Sphingomonas sp.]
MEARSATDLPVGPEWRYEPKWDGFRCIARIEANSVELYSKSGKRLDRYFPEVAASLAATRAADCILDGELVVEVAGTLSFSALQARLHPAESRIRRLSAETPARYILFDCLKNKVSLVDEAFAIRRTALESLIAEWERDDIRLSPQTSRIADARKWLSQSGGDTDGVVAKRLDLTYLPGERAMVKVKRRRTADCVVGGFRYASGDDIVGSLLLGLYDSAGRLNHVGYTSSLSVNDRRALTPQLEALIEAPGFTGNAPGGPSRWSNDRSADWRPLKPELVAEVLFDHVTGDRFRHGTKFLRWRPDKAPRQCRMDQLAS